MFTEIIFGAGLRSDTPREVIEAIRLCKHGLNAAIDHPFFTRRTPRILCNGGSAHFPGTVKTKFWKERCDGRWYLHFRTNFKNSAHEIEEFLDWIRPYLDKGSGAAGLYAIVMGQNQRIPDMLYLGVVR